jgi:hypothetical protein
VYILSWLAHDEIYYPSSGFLSSLDIQSPAPPKENLECMQLHLAACSIFVSAIIKTPQLMESSKLFAISICGTITQAFRRLAQHLYSPGEGQPPTFDNLPTEILVLISDHLPIESQLSLSLVSKKVLSVLPLERTKANRDVKAVGRFLTMLVRNPDIPSMFVCLSCPKLYHWRQCDGFWVARCRHWVSRAPIRYDATWHG